MKTFWFSTTQDSHPPPKKISQKKKKKVSRYWYDKFYETLTKIVSLKTPWGTIKERTQKVLSSFVNYDDSVTHRVLPPTHGITNTDH